MTTFADDRLCLELARHEALTLLLDLDGTLIPFAPTVEAATLDRSALELLRQVRDHGVRIVIVSGRPRMLVEPFRSLVDGLWWVAEHGSWRCLDDRWVGPTAAPEIADLVGVFGAVTRVPGARLETKSESLCVHWRLVPPALKDDLIAGCMLACEAWLASHPEFERLDGVEMLEVRRRTSNKGRAVALVREHLPDARIIAIGDDRTDDDMFAVLRDDEIAIGVGATNRTRADRVLPDHVAVRSFLSWIVQTRTTAAPIPFPPLQSRRSVIAS